MHINMLTINNNNNNNQLKLKIMSTRCNVIVNESGEYFNHYTKKTVKYSESLCFYRHSDGYPESIKPILDKLMSWVKTDKIRDNISQFSGWLTVLGAVEYCSIPKHEVTNHIGLDGKTVFYKTVKIEDIEDPKDWKASSFEPATNMSNDIEYIYVIDLKNKSYKVWKASEYNYQRLSKKYDF